ncbi:uncharacterized protein DNG_01415 [Cephalotrichum gorgonifer]|uniref:DUF924-domain-containing protein n=1 Tax=Cephalotrichum gorgonifer TaxID=2041049 RepID=A0AAE8MT62_9PEZI|nr:uncharacterized protein DNG_01415 [Cephalotrichum gorgonifer]
MALKLNKAIFNPSLYAAIRATWFQDLPPTATVAPRHHTARWFGLLPPPEKSAFDAHCASSFAEALSSVSPRHFAIPSAPTWAAERLAGGLIAAPFLDTFGAGEDGGARDALAAVLLLDQVSRNVYRDAEGQGLVYTHFDRLARSLVHLLLALPPHPSASSSGEEKVAALSRPDTHPLIAASHAYRSWFYMPLMHSEHLRDHELYLSLMSGCREEAAGRGDRDVVAAIDQSLDFELRHVGPLKRFGRYPHRNEVLGRESSEEEKVYLKNGGETFGTG